MRAYTIHDQTEIYFLTWTIVDWIDVFTRQRYRDIVIESLKYCQANKGLGHDDKGNAIFRPYDQVYMKVHVQSNNSFNTQ